jgi:acetone carboxylase gamma subunit
MINYEDLQEGKVEGKHLKKMMSLTKDLMREIQALTKGEDAPDLHDQIITMENHAQGLRDVIMRAGRVNPK